ncbi:hypothetical protein PZA11_001311 [Diplocarpon coronariae]|uniref:Uncharacterized protein n=1 Tax=Diplocarpon coronariae TaxID=2795749 RepID=A0A218ZAW3_9HELO|nr:hypothetical protein JHW43_004181 [Diplocarpon mali]OWP04864.1 hypothetical protein B2J93_4190 [Marssonina coronariae]
MAPTNPSGPPPAPVLGAGSFAPQPRAAPARAPARQAAPNARIRPAYNPPADDGDQESDGDDEPPLVPASAITMYISVPLLIKGDSNLVALEPSLTANKVSLGIIEALKSMAYGQTGVPLVDEEGRPRPINVHVNAATTVEGAKNLVGERAVMERIAPSLEGMPTDSRVTKMNLAQALQKRERNGSEEPVETDSKRTRRH